MGYIVQTALPAVEPVLPADVYNYLRLPSATDDNLIGRLIPAAREHAEIITGRSIAQRSFRQVLDSFPYYTDTIQSQLAYPPSYYSLPLYATTLWNYSQMIKLAYPPCISVTGMRYIDTNGVAQTLQQDRDFILDRITEPARIFPIPRSYWPPNQYVANSLEIDFTAGYDPNAAAIDTHTVGAVPITGDTTASSATVSSVSSTAGITAGMFLSGAGVPAGATVSEVGSGTLTLSIEATATAAGVALTATPAAPDQQPDSVLVTGIPQGLWMLILRTVSEMYDHRWDDEKVRCDIDSKLWNYAIVDFQPSRG